MTLPVKKALCGWCLKPFERAQLVGVGDAMVCETCKPAYIENLRTREHRQQKNKYVYRAVSDEGERVTEAIEAATMDAARYALGLRGYRDIVFLEDDVTAATQRTFENSSDQKYEISPKQKAKAMQTKATFFGILWQSPMWCLVILVQGLIIYRNVAGGTPFSGWAWAAYIGLGLSIVLYFFVSLPLALYGQLIRAVEWGRWDHVEGAIARIKWLEPFMLVKLPAFELDGRSAQARAARGDLDTALEIMKPYESDLRIEPFLYYARLAQLHYDARVYDKVIKYYEMAIESAPHVGGNYLDMAMYQARLMKDVEQAKFYLEKGLEHTLVPYAQAWVEFIRGLIENLEGNLPEAKQFHQQSLKLMKPLINMPFMTGFQRLVSAHLAITLARMGDRQSAAAILSEVREWLVSARHDELLQECEAAIGESTLALAAESAVG